MSESDTVSIDAIDLLYTLGSILAIAYTTPVAAILAIPIGYLQYRVRRSEWLARHAAGLNGMAAKPVKMLLPPSRDNTFKDSTDIIIPAYTDKTTKLRELSIEEQKKLPFYLRVHLPPDQDVHIDNIKSTQVTHTQQIVPMELLLAHVPKAFTYKNLPDPPTNTSVPLGYDLLKKEIIWMDIAKDLVHGLIAGMTGTGKDALLRLWYVFLTSYNSPEDIQFIILDGKGEWMRPSLEMSPYMLLPPAGGIDIVKDEKGRRKLGSSDRMAESLDKVFDEITRRQNLFYKAGATNLASYQIKTGTKLPRIIIIATDVGEDFSSELETLVRILTMKARSFGINLLISMQTSSKQDTGWRSNLSLVMSGYQALQSADAPIIGISASGIRYRPSQLPNPEEYGISKGLFIVRKGAYQTIVKTAYLPDDVFEQYIDTTIERYERSKPTEDELFLQRMKQKYAKRSNTSITPLDLILEDYSPKPKEWVLSKEERLHVIHLRRAGWNKTDIMKNGLKYTSGPYYKQYSQDVDRLIEIIDNAGKP